MKKFFFVIILCFTFLPSLFADEFDDVVASSSKSEKLFVFTPGVRFSFLGIEPSFSFDIKNLELELACVISTGFTGKEFGVAPSFAIGYNTNPFDRGAVATFGLEYMYLTSSYTNMIVKAVGGDDAEEQFPGIHGLGIYYKGAYKFNPTFGLLWKFQLPLLIYATKDGVSMNINITNMPGMLGCFIIGLSTTSIGVEFSF